MGPFWLLHAFYDYWIFSKSMESFRANRFSHISTICYRLIENGIWLIAFQRIGMREYYKCSSSLPPPPAAAVTAATTSWCGTLQLVIHGIDLVHSSSTALLAVVHNFSYDFCTALMFSCCFAVCVWCLNQYHSHIFSLLLLPTLLLAHSRSIVRLGKMRFLLNFEYKGLVMLNMYLQSCFACMLNSHIHKTHGIRMCVCAFICMMKWLKSFIYDTPDINIHLKWYMLSWTIHSVSYLLKASCAHHRNHLCVLCSMSCKCIYIYICKHQTFVLSLFQLLNRFWGSNLHKYIYYYYVLSPKRFPPIMLNILARTCVCK